MYKHILKGTVPPDCEFSFPPTHPDQTLPHLPLSPKTDQPLHLRRHARIKGSTSPPVLDSLALLAVFFAG